MAREKKVHFNAALIQKVKAAVIAKQDASYKTICEAMETSSKGTAIRVLKSLSRMGVVAQTSSRKWIVLEKPDGTKLERPKGPRPRRRKVKRTKAKRLASRSQAAAPRAAQGKGEITLADKLQKLREIAGVAGKESNTARILHEVVNDVQERERARKIADALS